MIWAILAIWNIPNSKICLLECYYISDPKYVGKAKMCLGGVSLFWEIVNKQLKIKDKLTPAKHILALPT